MAFAMPSVGSAWEGRVCQLRTTILQRLSSWIVQEKSELHISVFHIYYLSDVKNQGKSTFIKFPIFFRVVRTVGDVGAQGAA